MFKDSKSLIYTFLKPQQPTSIFLTLEVWNQNFCLIGKSYLNKETTSYPFSLTNFSIKSWVDNLWKLYTYFDNSIALIRNNLSACVSFTPKGGFCITKPTFISKSLTSILWNSTLNFFPANFSIEEQSDIEIGLANDQNDVIITLTDVGNGLGYPYDYNFLIKYEWAEEWDKVY